jgi:hypothetical protein
MAIADTCLLMQKMGSEREEQVEEAAMIKNISGGDLSRYSHSGSGLITKGGGPRSCPGG